MPDFSEHFTGTREEILRQLAPLEPQFTLIEIGYESTREFFTHCEDEGNYGVDITGHRHEGDNDGLRDGLWIAIYPAQTPVVVETPPNE